ncbi:related to SCD6 - suppressor of clathrin deficiency [Cephalotrichum gorgonifer]|uniref:Related to SCD6 - suppressor of clathrin deficiency n=1 Tax=Cephalotrichum gorgonifer TaxID=2041049 RepID=A0AAE8SWQ3_9PEZI|nr:related to SCD6 - suppressor of clathrin deficiency [Cephalotrichum gorgonifer]
MSEYIGSRISLISKSDIRYVGTLHQINSEQSTVSLENVKSHGTEGRKSNPEDEIAASDQVYEYIIFRGSDVKDLRIEQQPAKETKPSAVPSDPAILGARPRPDAQQDSSAQAPVPAGPAFSQPGHPGPPQFNENFYGPPPGSWGRGGPGPGHGPGPGPAFNNMPYPPPPGWYPPPQGFPHGPGGPGPWNPNFPYPPNIPNAPMHPHPDQNQKSRATPAGTVGTPGTDAKQGLSGAAPSPKQVPPTQAAQPPTEPKSLGQGAPKPQPAADSKAATEKGGPQPTSKTIASPGVESAPTGPKNTRITPVVPVVPRPFPVPTSISAGAVATGTPAPGAAIQDATEAAKAAVALAMANMETGNNAGQGQAQNGSTMDNLAKRVDEMRVNAGRGDHPGRGRGRGGRGGASKVEVPKTDFDFAESNAKFNKEDLAKAASAGSPIGDGASGPSGQATQSDISEKAVDPDVYNKKRSFFDNISSEAKDRANSGGQKPGGREWRGEEQRKNIETFGQGSVDGGHRNYRGRGRGRGGSRGRGYQNRGGPGGYRGQGAGAPSSTPTAGQ